MVSQVERTLEFVVFELVQEFRRLEQREAPILPARGTTLRALLEEISEKSK